MGMVRDSIFFLGVIAALVVIVLMLGRVSTIIQEDLKHVTTGHCEQPKDRYSKGCA